MMPVREEPKTYNLGTLINEEKWVGSIEIGERFVDIIHGEGAELSVGWLSSLKKQTFLFSWT